jgi:predicted nucleic acid-binding protein
MIYLDTSVVVALLTPEERSAQALDWFAESREPLISSDWLITETHSALGIKQRHYGLSSGDLGQHAMRHEQPSPALRSSLNRGAGP